MTRELQIAVERAARAAQTDALVEALGVIQSLCHIADSECSREDADWRWARARAVLAKYAPDKEGGAE